MVEECSLKEDFKGGSITHINEGTIEIMELEIGQIDLRYAHTRVKRPEIISSLVASIENSAHMSPVITVKESGFCFVLIDGYMRVSAMKRCGRDTILAEIWQLKESDALIRVLMRTQERRWEALEQGLLIRELREKHNLSQSKIAHLLGRDKSWVSRRISLFEALPDEILEMVRRGQVSIWAASRIIVPLARANQDHAKAFTENLMKEHISTRDITKFFAHYQKANRKQREKMVLQPVLFLKALRAKEEEGQARSLKEGPEGRWLKDLKVAGHIFRRLIEELPIVLYPEQNKLQRRTLLTAFEDTKTLFSGLEQKIRRIYNDDNTRNQTNHSDIASKGIEGSKNQSDSEDLQKHCPEGSAGRDGNCTSKDFPLRGDHAHHSGLIQNLQG